MENKKYINSIHRLGRLGSLGSLAFMLGIPMVVCAVYDCFPSFGTVIGAVGPILAMMIPTAISEVFAYAPILGSASYITFITGNVMNLKLPVAINAQQIAGVEANTDESDAISTMAIALSSLETIIIIAIGILLLKPLAPVFAIPAINTATGFMVPALFGGLALGAFGKGHGKTCIKNKMLIPLLPFALIVLGLFTIPNMLKLQGWAIIAMIFVTIGWAYLLYKKGIVRMVNRDGSEIEE